MCHHVFLLYALSCVGSLEFGRKFWAGPQPHESPCTYMPSQNLRQACFLASLSVELWSLKISDRLPKSLGDSDVELPCQLPDLLPKSPAKSGNGVVPRRRLFLILWVTKPISGVLTALLVDRSGMITLAVKPRLPDGKI